jgi:hypothetical protein
MVETSTSEMDGLAYRALRLAFLLDERGAGMESMNRLLHDRN